MDNLDLSRILSFSDAKEVIWKAQNLHDASLNCIQLGEDHVLKFEISNLWWMISEEVCEMDSQTQFRFSLGEARILSFWGTDEEICLSAVFDFSSDNSVFRILTGDGGRSGTFDISRSTVEVLSTPYAVDRYGIPI
jgi:hypothetical protein